MIKVEKPIRKEILNVEAIRVYIPELMKEVDSTVESGEHPKLLVKSIIRRKTGNKEVEIVFLGKKEERHIEDLFYYNSDPNTWKTWGIIVLTIQQAKGLKEFLSHL